MNCQQQSGFEIIKKWKEAEFNLDSREELRRVWVELLG